MLLSITSILIMVNIKSNSNHMEFSKALMAECAVEASFSEPPSLLKLYV